MLHSINDLSNNKVISLLKHEFGKIVEPTIIANYHPDYQNTPGNIFYILNNGRYSPGRGNYFIVEEDGNYICSAGWNSYTCDIALGLTRMYTAPVYRNRFIVGHQILPIVITETARYNTLLMTVNEYNKSFYEWFGRNQKTDKLGNWPSLYKKFKPAGIRTIYNTLQYVVEYEK